MRIVGRFIVVITLVFIGGYTAEAASLYIDPAFSDIYRGDAIKLSVRLDVDEEAGECVNAVDGVITYSESIALVDISLGDSIFNMWVETPVIDKVKRTITFAGGLPNGYCGRVSGDPRLTNNIVELVFRSPGFTVGTDNDDPLALIQFAPETTAYLNDGFGTKAELTTYGAQIQLLDEVGPSLQDPWRNEIAEDNNPPQDFSITLQKNRTPFGVKYFIAFNTTDKETGMDHYEIIEEPLSKLGAFTWGRADAPWVTVRSPYVLKDQSMNSVIRVKALDKAGNEYIATLIPNEDERGVPGGYFVLGAGVLFIILLLLMIGFTGFKVYKRRKKRGGENVPETEAVLEDNQEHHED